MRSETSEASNFVAKLPFLRLLGLFSVAALLSSQGATAEEKFEYSPNRTSQQIELERELAKPWVSSPNADLATAFAPIKKLMRDDPYARIVLNQSESKLRIKGISGIEKILKRCDDEDKLGQGYYSSQPYIVDIRVNVPGIPVEDWEESSQQEIAKSFAWTVVQLPFLDYLFAMDTPSLCVQSDLSIGEAYDIFVHELTHFSESDPFFSIEQMLRFNTLRIYANSTVRMKGGELDAFVNGIRAEIRRNSKVGIVNSNRDYPIASLDGKIANLYSLRRSLTETYVKYYKNAEVRDDVVIYVFEALDHRIQILKNSVLPFVTELGDISLTTRLRNEIKNLESRSKKLRKLYPESL